MRIATMIHEATHHTGPKDITYNKNKAKALPQLDQLDNAANFQRYVMDVALNAPDGPIAPTPPTPPPPTPVPVAAPTYAPPESCCQIVKDFGTNPQTTWGFDPGTRPDLKSYWQGNQCDSVVGGTGAPHCNQTPTPPPTPATSGSHPTTCAATVPATPAFDTCCLIAKNCGCNPHVTWGFDPSARSDLKDFWKGNNCNDLVGGTNTPLCTP